MTATSACLRATVAILCAMSASGALGDDVAARALLQRQQQSDAFSLQLQQSIQNSRAGSLSPQQRLEFDALQRDQRLRQDDLFYRQDVQQRQMLQTTPPPDGAPRRPETLRFEQDRQAQRDRFSRETEQELFRPQLAVPHPQPAP